MEKTYTSALITFDEKDGINLNSFEPISDRYDHHIITKYPNYLSSRREDNDIVILISKNAMLLLFSNDYKLSEFIKLNTDKAVVEILGEMNFSPKEVENMMFQPRFMSKVKWTFNYLNLTIESSLTKKMIEDEKALFVDIS